MLIDIDIKIADNGGNLVHHFVKRFDDGDIADYKELNNHYLGESFKDFLSEYMSFSGHAVRERLISDKEAPTRLMSNYLTDESSPYQREVLFNIENSVINCNIRIGNKKVYEETIPITQPNKAEAIDILKNSENEGQKETSFDQEIIPMNKTINYAILNAIAKYEANLSIISNEDENERSGI